MHGDQHCPIPDSSELTRQRAARERPGSSLGLTGFDEPSGAAMFPAGVSPCGLATGSGFVRGAVVSALLLASGFNGRPNASFGAWGFSDWLCATAKAFEQTTKQIANMNRMRDSLGCPPQACRCRISSFRTMRVARRGVFHVQLRHRRDHRHGQGRQSRRQANGRPIEPVNSDAAICSAKGQSEQNCPDQAGFPSRHVHAAR